MTLHLVEVPKAVPPPGRLPSGALGSSPMAKVDWQRARDRDLARKAANASPPDPPTARRRAGQQDALAAFVERHQLLCFKCGVEKAEWAKTGVSKRGPWAICTSCVAERASARRATGDARGSAPDLTDTNTADASTGGRPPDATRTAAEPSHPAATETPSTDAKRPVVYTDGACTRNPGRGGYAAVIVGPLSRRPLVVSGGEAYTTNNRMEMRAVIEGLNALDPSASVEVVTDSEYVLKGFTEWLPSWVRRGWRTSSKKPVKNADLWKDMAAAAGRHGRVTWRWTRGHSGDRFNEMADGIAEAIASGG